MKKKIVIVTGSMAKGGAEGVIAQISNKLAERGWRIHIIGLLLDRLDYRLHENVDYQSLAGGRRSKAADSIKLIIALRKKIKRIDPDVVVSFMAKMNIITRFALLGTKRRFIAAERNDPSVGRGYLYRKLVERTYAAAETTVFQTSRAKAFFPLKIQAKGVIIPNPVAVMPEASDTPEKKIVAVGRLTKQKNHKLLIDAFEQVLKSHGDYELDIFGAGEMEKEIREYIVGKSLGAKVHLQGKVDNVIERIKDAYLFVHTADYEGMSNALLEAMAVGLPCVTTNCAGADDAIQNGVNGLLVPVGDCRAVVEAINKLLDDRAFASRLGTNARKSIDRYSVETITDQWETIIAEKQRGAQCR